MTRIITSIWLLSLFLAAAWVSNVEASTRFEIKQLVMSEAANSEVPISLALAVAKVESDFNARALSSAGARGVMQIMPATAKNEFGVAPKKLWNPRTNIRLGVQFLEQLYDQYDGRWDMALSHYNGGTIKGNHPHKYTRKYVKTVQKWQRVYQEQASLWEGQNDGNLFEADDEQDFADLKEWQPRRSQGGFEEVDYREEVIDEGWGDTRIIIVERSRNRGWHRPPPPRHRGYRPPPRHRGNAEGYFH